MTVITLHTADELLRLPDDGHRYELIEGELRKVASAGEEHGAVGVAIVASLHAHVRQHALGRVYGPDTGFLLSRTPDTVRAPDGAFVTAARVVKTSGYLLGAPDLAVEVVSPNDRWSDVEKKTAEYLRAGTRAVVVVDLETRMVRVSRKSGTDVTETVENTLEVDDVVPGWKLPLSEIFDA